MELFGLTGGVGMGKSTAAEILRVRGVQVVDTDELARSVVQAGEPALDEIKGAFGNRIVDSDGRLRRVELAQIVFADTEARRKLEAILHPRIRELWKNQIQIWRTQQRPLAAVVIPLLFETAAEAEFDATVCVACTHDSQMTRLRERGWSPAEMERRIAAQWPVEKKMMMADYVVWTEGDRRVLAAQLERIFVLE